MDDIELAKLVSDDIGRLYKNAKTYSASIPIHSLTFLRGLGNAFCDVLDTSFEAADTFDSKISSLDKRNMLRPHPIRRYLRTLQRNGNIATHPENFKFEEHDFSALAEEAISAALGLVEHLYCLKYPNEDLPDYKIAATEDNSLRDMCYRAMIEGDVEATHLAGMYFKEKADRINKSYGIVRSKDLFSLDAAPHIDQAMFWFKAGADKGHPDCLFHLGRYQSSLRETPKETLIEGELQICRASNLGHADAQALMGSFYMQGSTNFKQDFESAREYFDLAANQDHPGALGSLGAMYANGNGGNIDYAAAARCSLRSAEAGYPAAQFNMYLLLSEGKGVETNLAEALRWLNAAAVQNLPEAIFALAQYIYAGKIPDRKPVESFEYFERCFQYEEFRGTSALCAAELLSKQECSVKDWMRGAHIIQAGYEHIHTHNQLNEKIKADFIKIATGIAQKLRAHIREHGPDRNLNTDDLLACCLFDEHGAPITRKEEMIAEFKELLLLSLRQETGAAEKMQHWLLKRSFIQSQTKARSSIRPKHLAQTHQKKIGRNENCICGSGLKFKQCCRMR